MNFEYQKRVNSRVVDKCLGRGNGLAEMSQNPKSPGSSPRLGSHRSLLIIIEQIQLLSSTPFAWLDGSRDVPDTLFYRIPDTRYTRISNSTGFWIIPDNRFYRIMLGMVCQVSFKSSTH